MLTAGQRARAVLRRHAVDLLATLRINADHRCREPVGADHEVTHLERPEGAEAVRGQHLAVVGLSPTPHISQGCDLDRPGREQLGDRVGVEHVVQRVVQRAQVGVDLVAQGARQEPEALPRLHGRPGQDDPVDVLRLQRLHGLRHREVGLAGAGRADAEHDRVLVDRVDVPLLVQRLGPDGPSAVGQDVHAQHVGRALVRLGAEHADRPLDGLRGDALAGADDRGQLVEEPLGHGHLGRLAAERDLVAADVDVGLEVLLDQGEVLVAGAQQGDHRDARRNHDRVRRKLGLCHRWPGGPPSPEMR